MKTTNWTDELIEKLRKLWAEGMDASLIGAEIGANKNAVIGKAHRLGLPKRRDTPIRFQSDFDRRAYYAEKELQKQLERAARKAERERSRLMERLNLCAGTSKTSAVYRRTLPPIGEKTKAELRAMITTAVQNTAEAHV